MLTFWLGNNKNSTFRRPAGIHAVLQQPGAKIRYQAGLNKEELPILKKVLPIVNLGAEFMFERLLVLDF